MGMLYAMRMKGSVLTKSLHLHRQRPRERRSKQLASLIHAVERPFHDSCLHHWKAE